MRLNVKIPGVLITAFLAVALMVDNLLQFLLLGIYQVVQVFKPDRLVSRVRVMPLMAVLHRPDQHTPAAAVAVPDR